MTDPVKHGRWQDALALTTCSTLISDPPYSPRTHESEGTRNDGSDNAGLQPSFTAWGEREVHEYVNSWSPRTEGWMATLTDSESIAWYRDAYEQAGRCSFAPVSCVIRGMTVRMQGDGPSSWTLYLMVARPRSDRFIGGWTLPGSYIVPREAGSSGGRGKPTWLCDAIVRDYAKRVGGRVCDPCAGWGTFLVSADALGLDVIGADVDEHCVKISNAALRRTQRSLL